MALDNLKRQGKSAAVGLLGKNLRRVAGNLGNLVRGDITGPDSSESAPINRSRQGTNMLSFPIDVGADPGIGNHGHYIMFYINEQEKARLSIGNRTGGGSVAENLADPYNIPAFVRNYKAQFSAFRF